MSAPTTADIRDDHLRLLCHPRLSFMHVELLEIQESVYQYDGGAEQPPESLSERLTPTDEDVREPKSFRERPVRRLLGS